MKEVLSIVMFHVCVSAAVSGVNNVVGKSNHSEPL